MIISKYSQQLGCELVLMPNLSALGVNCPKDHVFMSMRNAKTGRMAIVVAPLDSIDITIDAETLIAFGYKNPLEILNKTVNEHIAGIPVKVVQGMANLTVNERNQLIEQLGGKTIGLHKNLDASEVVNLVTGLNESDRVIVIPRG